VKMEALAGRRILVVEDEYLIMTDIASSLEQAGAEVVGPAATVDEALRLVGDPSRIDAALLDINLRGVMAFPVADALADRGVPFVFSTGYDRSILPPRYAKAAFCEKPSELSQIIRTLVA
jgi:CheY-like chemotaxis protein